MKSQAAHDKREQILKEAWIGDAVLSLYVRRRILEEDGFIDGAKAQRMTANRFLSVYGEPSETEAIIGRVFETAGLDAACAWIEANLSGHFERQEAQRTRPKTARRTSFSVKL